MGIQDFFNNIPFYVYWIFGLVLVFGIYTWVLDESTKSSVKIFLKTYGVWIGLFIGWLFCRSYWGYFTPDDWMGRKANTYFLIFAMLWGIATNFLGKERYISTQAICDNRSGSCAKYEEIGDYVVLNIGSTDAPLFPWDLGHSAWCVPKRHFNKINNIKNASATQIKIATQVQKCDLEELPAQIHDFIETTSGYNKEDVWYGEFSLDELKSGNVIEVDGKKVDMKEYETKLKDTNRMLNESRTMLKGKTSAIKGFVSDASTIQKKASGRSAFSSNEQRPKESEY